MNKIIEALSNNGFATADYLVFIIYIIILRQPTTSWPVTP